MYSPLRYVGNHLILFWKTAAPKYFTKSQKISCNVNKIFKFTSKMLGDAVLPDSSSEIYNAYNLTQIWVTVSIIFKAYIQISGSVIEGIKRLFVRGLKLYKKGFLCYFSN